MTTAGIVGLATLLRIGLSSWLHGAEFITFFPAVMLTSFLFGARAGVISALLSAAGALAFVMEPGARNGDSAAFFILVAGLDVAIIAALRTAIARAAQLNDSLKAMQSALATEKRNVEEANISKIRFLAAASHDLLKVIPSHPPL